ncbi:MAG: hypothetical protein ACXAC5_00080 [Promethearchaeota archaeon]
MQERYPGENTELRNEHARDQYEQEQSDRFNNYFIRETFRDPTTGQETEQFSEDGYVSAEEALSIAQNNLQDSMEAGAISIDIVHKTNGWIQSVWDRDSASAIQPMTDPFPR